MLVSLAVFTILAQDVAPPPPPPPLVPANPVPYNNRFVPAQPPPGPPPAPPPNPPVEEPREQSSIPTGTRIAGSIGAGVVGAAITTGGIVYVGSNHCGASSSCNTGNGYLGIATVLVGAALISLGAWGAHRLLGGRSSVGWALLGMFAGAAVGLLGTLLGDSYANAGSSRGLAVPYWGYTVVGTLLAAVGAGTMPEIGHALMLRQEAQSMATTPRF